MMDILKYSRIKWTKLNVTEGIKLGAPGTNGLSQMNKIVSKNEIKELK